MRVSSNELFSTLKNSVLCNAKKAFFGGTQRPFVKLRKIWGSHWSQAAWFCAAESRASQPDSTIHCACLHAVLRYLNLPKLEISGSSLFLWKGLPNSQTLISLSDRVRHSRMLCWSQNTILARRFDALRHHQLANCNGNKLDTDSNWYRRTRWGFGVKGVVWISHRRLSFRES